MPEAGRTANTVDFRESAPVGGARGVDPGGRVSRRGQGPERRLLHPGQLDPAQALLLLIGIIAIFSDEETEWPTNQTIMGLPAQPAITTAREILILSTASVTLARLDGFTIKGKRSWQHADDHG